MKFVAIVLIAAAVSSEAGVKLIENVDYVGKGKPRQTLDVLVSDQSVAKKRPLVVFIHGGGWNSGSKNEGLDPMRRLAATGEYVTATINYRLVPKAVWPAQIHDCKAAIRFLRGKADEYGIDPARIGVIGVSAGGHLVSMLGTTNGAAEFEGKLGQFPKQSSAVQCVVSYCGPVDFLTMGVDLASPNPISGLLGGAGPGLREKAGKASPVTWVTPKTVPFLIAHGTADTLVPFSQAEEMKRKLSEVGVESHLIAMKGAGHGFGGTELDRRVKAFFDKELRDRPVTVSDAAIEVR